MRRNPRPSSPSPSPPPLLLPTRLCPFGNPATLYSTVDKRYISTSPPLTPSPSFTTLPNPILRCSFPHCLCRSPDHHNNTIFLSHDSPPQPPFMFFTINNTNFHIQAPFVKPQYLSYTDILRQLNHSITTTNQHIPSLNQLYEKKIEMYDTQIKRCEVQREWLVEKMRRKDLGLYLHPDEHRLINQILTGEGEIDITHLNWVKHHLEKPAEQRVRERACAIRGNIIRTENDIRHALENTREQYSRELSPRQDHPRQHNENPEFSRYTRQKLSEFDLEAQHIKFCQEYIFHSLSLNNQPLLPVPPYFPLHSVTSLHIQPRQRYLNYERTDPRLAHSFPSLKHFALTLPTLSPLEITKIIIFRDLHTFSLLANQLPSTPPPYEPIFQTITSSNDLQKLTLKHIGINDRLMEGILGQHLPILAELDLSYNGAEINKVFRACRNLPLLRRIRVNTMDPVDDEIVSRASNYYDTEYMEDEKPDIVVGLQKRPKAPEQEEQEDTPSFGKKIKNNPTCSPFNSRQEQECWHMKKLNFDKIHAKETVIQRNQRTILEANTQVLERGRQQFDNLPLIPSLQALHISNNTIQEYDFVRLAKLCTHLTTLNISYNPIGDQGLLSLIQNIPNLKHLYMSLCSITDLGLISLAHSHLNLITLASRNNIASSPAISILLTNQPTLKHVDLRMNFTELWNFSHTEAGRLSPPLSKGFIGLDTELKSLKKLYIREAAETGVYYLAKLKGLKELRIDKEEEIKEKTYYKLLNNIRDGRSLRLEGYLREKERTSNGGPFRRNTNLLKLTKVGRNMKMLGEIKRANRDRAQQQRQQEEERD